MDIIWDEKKNEKLIAERGVSFDLVAELILQREHVVLKTIFPSRKFHNLYGAKSHEKDS